MDWYDQIRILENGEEIDGCSRACPHMGKDHCICNHPANIRDGVGQTIPTVIFAPFPEYLIGDGECPLPHKVVHNEQEYLEASFA